MNALLDTCVIIDVLQERDSFFEDSLAVLNAVADNKFCGYISAKSITDIYYLTRKYIHNESETRKVIQKLLELFDLADTAGNDCKSALLSEMTDYEDAVLVQTALRCDCDCIITRNIKDFDKAAIRIFTPKEFLIHIS